ncbi:MAG: hypothetical protein ACR2GP_11095 [Burkholderiaceae bacterium]
MQTLNESTVAEVSGGEQAETADVPSKPLFIDPERLPIQQALD